MKTKVTVEAKKDKVVVTNDKGMKWEYNIRVTEEFPTTITSSIITGLLQITIEATIREISTNETMTFTLERL